MHLSHSVETGTYSAGVDGELGALHGFRAAGVLEHRVLPPPDRHEGAGIIHHADGIQDVVHRAEEREALGVGAGHTAVDQGRPEPVAVAGLYVRGQQVEMGLRYI